MKTICAVLLAVLIALAAPVSAEPIAIGEFAFNFNPANPDDPFDPFFQYFSVANFLPSDHALAGLLWGARVRTRGFNSSDDALLPLLDGDGLSLLDANGDPVLDINGAGPLVPGESAITGTGAYLGRVQLAELDFGNLVGFSAGILTFPQDLGDPFAIFVQPAIIFYDAEAASVPEPGTLLLIGSGLALVALRGRRRVE